MEFNFIEDGIDAIVIDNFYNEQQLSEIMDELKFLTKPSIFCEPKKLAAATDDNNNVITSKRGVWVDTVINWNHSSLIKYPWDNLCIPEVKEKIIGFNSMYRIMYACDWRSNLLSYYENSDYYDVHHDDAIFTVLNYFHTTPKKFTGGEIKLYSSTSNKIATVEVKQNRVVIIPSVTKHEVLEIKSDLKNTFSGDGRYCNSIFLQKQILKAPNDSN